METNFLAFWQKSQLVIKAGFIAALTLLLLIPMSFISGLVRERQQRRDSAYKEISDKWASAQTLVGPVLMIPYHSLEKSADGNTVPKTRYGYFLPDSLDVTGTLLPEKRHRGIYEVTLYRSDLRISGAFRQLDVASLNVPADAWMPEEAVLMLGTDDLRGIENRLSVDWNGAMKFFDPGVPPNTVLDQGVSVPLALGSEAFAQGKFAFSIRLSLKGSGSLRMVPAGKSTTVQLSSSWPSPSFTGRFLPGASHIDAKGFSGRWTIFNLNRNFPQRWTDGEYDLSASAFGVDLMQPVDFYQKTMRCIKYAILIIALTFTVFFLVETSTRRPVHPIQYLLIGLALCVFYTLLISISEYLYFAWAYGIAAAATTALITLYACWVFRDRRMPVVAGCSLALLYGYIFVLMQLEDFALLAGSIGLFVVLAVLMYFSRHINRDPEKDLVNKKSPDPSGAEPRGPSA
jgi:inner membrane protein